MNELSHPDQVGPNQLVLDRLARAEEKASKRARRRRMGEAPAHIVREEAYRAINKGYNREMCLLRLRYMNREEAVWSMQRDKKFLELYDRTSDARKRSVLAREERAAAQELRESTGRLSTEELQELSPSRDFFCYCFESIDDPEELIAYDEGNYTPWYDSVVVVFSIM